MDDDDDGDDDDDDDDDDVVVGDELMISPIKKYNGGANCIGFDHLVNN